MKPILVFRHVAHESLGTIEPFLRAAQIPVEFCDLFRSRPIPDVSRYSMIISMGGPMNVDEVERYPFLLNERKAIQKAINLDLPVLGICLGSQMIARALGAKVKAGPKKEIGWFPITLTNEGKQDPVLGASGRRFTVFHWHGDTFDLPKGAVLLASSESFAHQAFRFKNNVYAFQFHVEMTPRIIHEWMKEGESELESVGYVSPERIFEETKKHGLELENLAASLYERLFQCCDIIRGVKES